MRPLYLCLLILIPLSAVNLTAEDLPSEVHTVLMDRCSGCHDASEKSGDLDLVELIETLPTESHPETWEKIDLAIANLKMPPEESDPLNSRERKLIGEWFEQQFVTPGGIQHAGHVLPRRLTREELQNTLEDILHVEIRANVTNSRLHVIPETIIEKFFAIGVIGGSGFSNDAATLSKESVNIQNYARCFSLVLSLLDSNANARKHLFGTDLLPLNISDDQASQIIKKFGRSAFRREISEEEFAAIHALYEKKSDQPYQAMKSAMLATLLSPAFLFRFEEPSQAPTRVTDAELAVRLSYFLWSSPPDDELLRLATEGELHHPETLRAQVKRMLADPKRIALSENLGGEWFDYKKLRQKSSVDKRSDRMAGFYRTQYEEALLMFDSLVRYDQPLFRIVDADWAFLNRHQAGIYGLQAVPRALESSNALPPISIHFRSTDRQVQEGTYEYRHAPLTMHDPQDADRFGFLTLGSTLTATSTENRTSPIRRGVWVMERLLGEHFKVPDDVPDLASTEAKIKSEKRDLDFKEILKLHSSQEGCSACHRFIDPIGFTLEVFDQRGVRRQLLQDPPEGGEKLSWDPSIIQGVYSEQRWRIQRPLVPDQATRVFFNYTKGGQRLDIRNVRLRSGQLEISDKHFGFTGGARRDNIWSFPIPPNAPTTGWELIAEIKGDGGNDSYGVITVASDELVQAAAASYQLPNGQRFRTPSELRDLLLNSYRDQLIDNAVRKVLSYALGRKLMPIDRVAIREIKEQIEVNDYRMTALIEAVALSYPFCHKEFQ